MSTLKTNTIQHLTSGFNNVVAHTDGAGTANAVHARAWVNFDGTSTVTIRAQFNVSSITDRGTGLYTVNFSNAMTDANYSSILSASANGATVNIAMPASMASRTSSSLELDCYSTTVALQDIPVLSVTIFR